MKKPFILMLLTAIISLYNEGASANPLEISAPSTVAPNAPMTVTINATAELKGLQAGEFYLEYNGFKYESLASSNGQVSTRNQPVQQRVKFVLASTGTLIDGPLKIADVLVKAPATGCGQLTLSGIDLLHNANEVIPATSVSTQTCIEEAPRNHRPSATNSAVNVPYETALQVVVSASDGDGNPLSYRVVSAPLHGQLSGAGPVFTYTPYTGYSGADSFIFVASDGQEESDNATVALTIAEKPILPNRLPVASDGFYNATQNTPAQVTLAATDGDGDPLSYRITRSPLHGSLSDGTSSTRIYTPTTDYKGTDSFTFTASDGKGESNIATITVNVGSSDTAAPPPPTLQISPSFATLQAGQVRQFSLNPNISAKWYVDGELNGTIDSQGNYHAPAIVSINRSVTIRAIATDGSGRTATAVVSLVVSGGNRPPVAPNINVTTSVNTPIKIPLKATDPEGDPITFLLLNFPEEGTGTIIPLPPIITYTPPPNYTGEASFRFQAYDGQSYSATATVTILVSDKPLLLLGDVNGDGKITASDAGIALRIAVGIRAATEDEKSRCDLVADGKIDLRDVTRILRKAVGLG